MNDITVSALCNAYVRCVSCRHLFLVHMLRIAFTRRWCPWCLEQRPGHGGIDQRGVLFNFVDATSISANGYGLWGTMLAPYAHVSFNQGSFDGGIYAQSLTGNTEGHINPLYDHDLCIETQP